MDKKSLNFKVPEKLYNLLKEEADKKSISLAAMIRIICSEYFENKK